MNRQWQRGFDVAKAARVGSNARPARRMGAALYSGSNLLSLGYNTYFQTHPSAKWGLHAEHRALLRRQYHTSSNLILYVYRETADGKAACSKPCDNCVALAREAGVRIIRFLDEKRNPAEIIL